MDSKSTIGRPNVWEQAKTKEKGEDWKKRNAPSWTPFPIQGIRIMELGGDMPKKTWRQQEGWPDGSRRKETAWTRYGKR